MTAALAAGPGLAAGAAIRIVPLDPAPGGGVVDARTPIAFELRTRGDATLRRSDVDLVVDGRDRSAALQIVGTRLEYVPAAPLAPGTHRVEVRVRGALPDAWRFTVASDDVVPTRAEDDTPSDGTGIVSGTNGTVATAANGDLAPIAPYALPYGVGGYGQPYNYGAYGVPVVPGGFPAGYGGSGAYPSFGGGYPAYGGGYGAAGYGAPGAYGYATGAGYGSTIGGGFGTYVAPSPFGTFYVVGAGPFGPGSIVRFVFVGVPGGTGYVSAPGLIGRSPLIPFAPGYYYALGRVADSSVTGAVAAPVAHFSAAGLPPFAVPSRRRVPIGTANADAGEASAWRPRLARSPAQFTLAIRPPRSALAGARPFAPLVYRSAVLSESDSGMRRSPATAGPSLTYTTAAGVRRSPYAPVGAGPPSGFHTIGGAMRSLPVPGVAPESAAANGGIRAGGETGGMHGLEDAPRSAPGTPDTDARPAAGAFGRATGASGPSRGARGERR